VSQKSIFTRLAALLVGNGLSQVINTLFILILVRIFTQEQYAIYRLGNQMIVTLSPFFVFGLPMTISMFIPKYKDKETRMRFVFQTIFLLFGLGLIGGILIQSNHALVYRIFGNEKLLDYLWVFALSFFTEVVFSYFPFYMTSENKNRKLAISVTALSLVKVSSILFAILMGNDFQIFMYAFAVSCIIRLIYVIVEPLHYYRAGIIKKFKRVDTVPQLKQSIPIGMTNVVAAFGRNLGSNLVAIRYDTIKYAIYVTGAFEVPLIGILRTSITGAVLPNFSQMFSDSNLDAQDEIIKSFRKTVALSSIIVMPLMIGLITYSYGAIALLFPGFQESNVIFKIFMLLLPTQIANFSTLLLVANRQKKVLFYCMMGIVINISAFYILANTLGFFFVAFSTVLSEYMQLVLILYDVKKSYHQKSIFSVLPMGLLLRVIISNTLISTGIFMSMRQTMNPNLPLHAVFLGAITFSICVIINALFIPEIRGKVKEIVCRMR